MKPYFPSTWLEGNKQQTQFAHRISEEDLTLVDSIRLCPGIYQACIEKAFELRVVIMGERIICAKIDSQSVDTALVDWRADISQEARVEPFFELPDTIKASLLDFMQAMGLEFGSIDLIVTKDHEFVFLEVNDQGQFLWLDDRHTEFHMLAEFSAFIATKGGYSANYQWPTLADYRNSECGQQCRACVKPRSYL